MANTSLTRQGTRVTDKYIRQQLTKSYANKHAGQTVFPCWFQGLNCEGGAVDNSHLVAKSDLKNLGLADLIWHPEMYENSCRVCHREHEQYKSGLWLFHRHTSIVLSVLHEYDLQGWKNRIYHDYQDRKQIERLIECLDDSGYTDPAAKRVIWKQFAKG